jgi:hypothetical protein
MPKPIFSVISIILNIQNRHSYEWISAPLYDIKDKLSYFFLHIPENFRIFQNTDMYRKFAEI